MLIQRNQTHSLVRNIFLLVSIVFWGVSIVFFGVSVVFLNSGSVFAEEPAAALAANLPEYSSETLEQSSLSSIGSDSMGGLMTKWVSEYRKYQPNVRLQLVSRGSALAPAALVEGTADLGPMARPMKTSEREDFLTRYGFEPTQIRAAASAAAIYVHADNPIESISLAELEQVFGASPKRGKAKRLNTWGQLSVGGAYSGRSISPLGREGESYISGYFRQRVLLQGKFVSSMKSLKNTRSLFDAILADSSAIGFAEYDAALPAGLKMLKVRKETSEPAYMPTPATIAKASYPLSRFLSIYVVRTPGEPLDETTADFLKFILSRQGQELVLRLGMRPLSADALRAERKKLL